VRLNKKIRQPPLAGDFSGMRALQPISLDDVMQDAGKKWNWLNDEDKALVAVVRSQALANGLNDGWTAHLFGTNA
jgi:hypothetical protein